MNAQTWDDILADRSLRDLPYKIETNRYHQIIMSPASFLKQQKLFNQFLKIRIVLFNFIKEK